MGRGTGEQFYEDLEETLIQADLSVPTAAAVIARLRERARGGARTPEALRRALVEILADALEIGRAHV